MYFLPCFQLSKATDHIQFVQIWGLSIFEKVCLCTQVFFPSFSLSDVVCFGVGAGANVLTELAVSYFLALQIQ